MRLSAAIQGFNAQLTADGKSDHTRWAYLRDLGEFRSWLRTDPAIADIDPATLARYLSTRVATTRPVISANRTRAARRAFLQFLMDAGCSTALT